MELHCMKNTIRRVRILCSWHEPTKFRDFNKNVNQHTSN